MKQYLDLLQRIAVTGEDRKGRNGDTRALFGLQFRHDMRRGFPAVTTKELKFRSVVGELLWFLSGSTSDEDLKRIMGYNSEKRTIWSANAEDWKAKGSAAFKGDLGRIYGRQWRSWRGCSGRGLPIVIDQIRDVTDRLLKNPNDRRLIVTAWNPADVDQMALPSCHVMFQLFAHADGGLSLSMVQRSCDFFLGVPFNIASYGVLLHLFAATAKRYPRELIITFQDAHIYHEHFKAVEEQLARRPYDLPGLQVTQSKEDLWLYEMGDIALQDYVHHPAIKAEMIV